MAENSKIEWTDHTFNPWEGCTKVSEGCAHCYAEARNHRFGMDNWGKGKPRRRTSKANWRKPIQWNSAQTSLLADPDTKYFMERKILTVARPRVFCASLADWLDDEVPVEWLADLLGLIHDTPQLNWLLLTKRPQNWRDRLCRAIGWIDREWLRGELPDRPSLGDWVGRWVEAASPHRGMGSIPDNIWLGTSVENQKAADERIPILASIPAKVRFLSVEPMLERIDFSEAFWRNGCEPHCGDKCSKDADCPMELRGGIHWAIFGGESGRGARPLNIDWIRNGVEQCRDAGVSPFVKQLGAQPCQDLSSILPEADVTDEDEGVDAASIAAWEYRRHNSPVRLKDPKGGDWSEWPKDLRVREFPCNS